MKREHIAQVALFIFAFTLLVFLFSLIAWGHGKRMPHPKEPPFGFLLDAALHPLAGALAVAPSRRWSIIILGAVFGSFLDVDHIGKVVGLPIPTGASHSVLFIALAVPALAVLATMWKAKGGIPPALIAAVTLAAYFSHLAVDAWVSDGYVLLWAPFSYVEVQVPIVTGVILEVSGFMLVWFTARWFARQADSSAPTGAMKTRPR